MARMLASRLLAEEARALLSRLARIRPFALTETMVAAAAVGPGTMTAIERYLAAGRRELRVRISEYLRWLTGPAGRTASPATLQRRFTFLRLRFNVVLTQFDIFSDVLTQRSEHDNGVLLAGLDLVAADALALPGGYYRPPPLVCYLDRGHGAAIRRQRTRLPGGGENPVAVVRVPRERMVGSGIASSLVHEVGHQAAALLDLAHSLRPVLRARAEGTGRATPAWRLWERWISEIVADFWSVARIGVSSTLGLMGVVSLPRVFVFRLNPQDPHPIPWVRVRLSCALGRAMYPHPQWDELARIWESYYPRHGLDPRLDDLLERLERSMPEFVDTLLTHRPAALRGRALAEVMGLDERQPQRLLELHRAWRTAPSRIRSAPPALVFAVMGQARATGELGPEEETRTLVQLLQYWALRANTLRSPMATRPAPRAVAVAIA